MRESMARLTPRFSAGRAVREYTEEHYLPAAAAYRARSAEKGAAARRLADWRDAFSSKWAELRFGAATVETKGRQHVIAVEVFLGDAGPDTVRVELYADGAAGGAAVRQEMTRASLPAGGTAGFVYSAAVSSSRPAADYTARIMANRDGLAVPLEAGWILWQK
jgi:starch phosphorylase